MAYDSEMGAELAKEMPSVFPRDPDSGNYKLFQVIGHEGDSTVDDKDAVDRAMTVQHADTVDQLHKLGELVDVKPREGESREKYRSRVLAKYQLVTCEGTIADIIHSVAIILDVEPERIQFRDAEETAEFGMRLTVPLDELESVDLTDEELAEVIDDLSAAGVGVTTQTQGTFKYISRTTYQAIQDGEDTWANYPGFDGYDETSGERKNLEDAGTYGGTLRS